MNPLSDHVRRGWRWRSGGVPSGAGTGRVRAPVRPMWTPRGRSVDSNGAPPPASLSLSYLSHHCCCTCIHNTILTRPRGAKRRARVSDAIAPASGSSRRAAESSVVVPSQARVRLGRSRPCGVERDAAWSRHWILLPVRFEDREVLVPGQTETEAMHELK